MPTYEALPRFTTDLHRLTPAQRCRFQQAVSVFVEGLHSKRFRPGLRIKAVQSVPGVFELTWAVGPGAAGRATWSYGPEVIKGTPHVIWRRIGTHDILTRP